MWKGFNKIYYQTQASNHLNITFTYTKVKSGNMLYIHLL